MFGIQTYHTLTDNMLKKYIKKHPSAFSLGLQGPDIFFYSPVSYLRKENTGSILHETHTGEFFQNMLAYKDQMSDSTEKEAVTAYIAGFLGHYTLDCIFHPYVYAKTGWREDEAKRNDYYGKHFKLECEFDILFLKSVKELRPEEFYQSKTICLPRREQKAIARLLSNAVTKTYGQINLYGHTQAAIISTQLATALLHDSTGSLKKNVQRIEKKLLGCSWISEMIEASVPVNENDVLNLSHSFWQNPWNPKLQSCETVYELLESAISSYYKLLLAFDRQIRSPHWTEPLLKRIGNKSYHSGLENQEKFIPA